jgi:hypothetical protein
MTDQDQVLREQLNYLERVKYRIQLLDLIEEKLLQMRMLAHRVIDEDLTEKEIQKINKEVKHLEEQVNLLDRQSTQQS